jgi:hypothetical protein
VNPKPSSSAERPRSEPAEVPPYERAQGSRAISAPLMGWETESGGGGPKEPSIGPIRQITRVAARTKVDL